MAFMSSVLSFRDVTLKFGGITALNSINFDVNPGELYAIIGPNGAGKTTLFNLITGFDKPDSGKWTFHQLSNAESWTTDLSGLRPHQIANKGMVRTFQLTKSLAKMTVIDNMLLGAAEQKGESLRNALYLHVGKARKRNLGKSRGSIRAFQALTHAR